MKHAITLIAVAVVSSNHLQQQSTASLKLLADPLDTGQCMPVPAAATQPMAQMFGPVTAYVYTWHVLPAGLRTMSLFRDSLDRVVSYNEVALAPDSAGVPASSMIGIVVAAGRLSGFRTAPVRVGAPPAGLSMPIQLDDRDIERARDLMVWVFQRCSRKP